MPLLGQIHDVCLVGQVSGTHLLGQVNDARLDSQVSVVCLIGQVSGTLLSQDVALVEFNLSILFHSLFQSPRFLVKPNWRWKIRCLEQKKYDMGMASFGRKGPWRQRWTRPPP